METYVGNWNQRKDMENDEQYQGFSRVMTRPAGRVKEISKSRGLGRVGSDRVKRFQNLVGRVGSGPGNMLQNLAGPVGSGRVGSRGFKIPRVGSGRVKRFSKSRGSGRVMTRETRVTRESSHHDPRIVLG